MTDADIEVELSQLSDFELIKIVMHAEDHPKSDAAGELALHEMGWGLDVG